MALDSGFGSMDLNPPAIPPEQIIKQFAAKESEFQQALNHYTYRRTAKVQTIDDDTNKPDGEYYEVDDVVFDPSGARTEKVVFAPQNTLSRVMMSPSDLQDIQKGYPFVLTAEDIGQYDVKYVGRQKVDEVDCYVLDEFADGFGRVYERAVLLERLNGQRDHVRETLRAAETIMDNLARAELELARHADERSMIGAAAAVSLAGESSALNELLTPREREVIALIVSGQSNNAIAERLVISEGTVKSHVKQILRKLGAVNRSEVIARYLGMIGPN